jgi:hypothetical protein
MRKERRRMNAFVAKFQHIVKGIISGFDRIVFKGTILPLMHDKGAMRFCREKGILNKDFKEWMQTQTGEIIAHAEGLAKQSGGDGILPIFSSHLRKEELARERQKELGIQSGLIGVYAATESCLTYKAVFSKEAGHPLLRRQWGKCKHLYFYYDHAHYGFMNVRLQTWFPYHVQICLNGREWLRRQLESQNVDFLAKGNKFLHIGDYERAQQLLDSQLDTRFEALLNGLTSAAFPARRDIVGPDLSYYWTLWQSEWATDFIFPSPKDIAPLADSLLRHAFMTGTGPSVLRYLGCPLKLDGSPRADMNHDVTSRLLDFYEGLRVRHWVDENSVKGYNEWNNFRVEMTMNRPGMFRVYRHAQGQPQTEANRLMPLRKSIADIPLRAKISQEINDRFLENLAVAQCETPVRQLLDAVVKPFTKDGRRVRALDPTGKDRPLLQALNNPDRTISGLSNKELRDKLRDKPGYRRMNEKQLSAKISRQIRLLRDHGLLRKLPRQKRYLVSRKGQELSAAIGALLTASTKQLMEVAA